MKVLFIGNSHTYFNDMPALFAEMCEALGGSMPEISMLAFSDRSLKWHRQEYFSIRFALLYGNFDFCVIQQYGHPFPGYAETKPYLGELVDLCRRVGTEPVLLMTWAKKNEPDAIESIASAYRALASECGVRLIPVGELFRRIADTHPEIDLYRRDGSHASPCGSYLIAASIAAALLQPKDLTSLTDRSFDFHVRFSAETPPTAAESRADIPIVLPPETARVLRRTVEQSELLNRDKTYA